ncbi:mitogen-activated protein kinase kinase 10-like [Tripterygium wilfordii]|uniref:mitogen-activated protein kinase kinase 10-like n=1 Tax=Tripterygium wilfordii TaxID=458696 RepID=UPI0018F81776|nr:mitogen-activated protein kinase kinase 10-like [Tripterygium wilfordii]
MTKFSVPQLLQKFSFKSALGWHSINVEARVSALGTTFVSGKSTCLTVTLQIGFLVSKKQKRGTRSSSHYLGFSHTLLTSNPCTYNPRISCVSHIFTIVSVRIEGKREQEQCLLLCVYRMTTVRKRRHQQALTVSLPSPPIPAADFRHGNQHPASLPATSPDSPDIENLSDLEKLSILGHGSGGTVYKVSHRQTSSVFALKVLRFHGNTSAVPHHEEEILKRVNSPFVVQCHAVLYKDDDLCFVMEHMEMGSLHDVLIANRVLPEVVAAGVARCVLHGLQYLHGMQIVHGDIKPSNLLVNAKGDVKIADFGVSKVVGGSGIHDVSDICMGTCAYMSPERFDPERWGGEGGDGFAGDVWSLGVVVLECLVGHYPLIGTEETPDWAALMFAICFKERPEMPDSASLEFCDFVGRCLEKDWKRRGTVEELLGHPFVNSEIL